MKTLRIPAGNFSRNRNAGNGEIVLLAVFGRLMVSPSEPKKPKSRRHKSTGFWLWPARRDSNPRPSESESAAISSFATGGYSIICLFKATVILPRLPEKSNRSHQKIRKGRTPPMKETARRQNPAAGPSHHCRTNTDLGCPQRGHCQVSGSFSKGSSPS